jgi:hypothetical protein
MSPEAENAAATIPPSLPSSCCTLYLVSLQIPDTSETVDFRSKQVFTIGTDGRAVRAGIGMHPGVECLFLLATGAQQGTDQDYIQQVSHLPEYRC